MTARDERRRSLVGVSVGTALPTLTLPPVSRTTLALFAGASGDHNPVHIDLDVAKAAGFDDVFAQGMLGMAYLGRLLTDWVDQAYIRSFEVRFTAITPLYARPTCTGTVSALRDDEAVVDVEVTLEDGTRTLSGRAVIGLSERASGSVTPNAPVTDSHIHTQEVRP